MIMEWLRRKAPGFNDLTNAERNAIADFSLLWSLFEAQVLDNNGSAGRICSAVDGWRDDNSLEAEVYDPELSYFRHRYFSDEAFTHHFEHLHLRQTDQPALVRAVINGSNNDPRDRVVTVLIVVLRFRNNLFHGLKWQYKLADQLENFTNANRVLIKVLERHGQLE